MRVLSLRKDLKQPNRVEIRKAGLIRKQWKTVFFIIMLKRIGGSLPSSPRLIP